tara:strand:+ start:171 stop:482 length:312 start_codon:yes stop_codon:yes gene_type:complete
MTKQIASLMTYWPIVMLGFAGVSSGFAFYHSMQNLQSDFIELKRDLSDVQNKLIRKESIDLELKLRDTRIDDLNKSFEFSVRQQEDINRSFEEDVKYLHRSTR